MKDEKGFHTRKKGVSRSGGGERCGFSGGETSRRRTALEDFIIVDLQLQFGWRESPWWSRGGEHNTGSSSGDVMGVGKSIDNTQ